ncbi:MAG: transketolase, partial [Acetobacteraceae bacterium]
MSARRFADAVRALAIGAIETGSGHPGIPLGIADAASVLWLRFLKFDAADPSWPDRDRFILAAGHGSMLLYALLRLTGHAIETTTGPLEQGFANAVGMALAERLLAARFGRSLVDHRTWALASDGDLVQGLSHEAAALAGHLKLSRLTVLYEDNGVSIDGATRLAVTDDPLKRFAALGWRALRVDGHDPAEVAGALSFAMRSPRPTLIVCRTVIGFGAPPLTVPADVAAVWKAAGAHGATARRAWLRRLTHHALRAEFERVMEGRLPERLPRALADLKAQFAAERPRIATREASRKVLEAVVPLMAELLGGSAGLTASNLTAIERMPAARTAGFAGRTIHYGMRAHGMAAAMNGLARHGGMIPYGGTSLACSDYMRPALRLACLMRARVIYVFTDDSIGRGEDGPAHQPIEHLASLRAIPNLFVFRPADAVETAECW